MSPLLSIRPSGTSAPERHRSGEARQSPPTGHDEGALPLPRHLLVELAGVAADVTSLRQQVVDDPQLHHAVDRILGRLDGLVDSIYERAADAAGAPR